MKIKNITIENFRSAKELSINLDENLNVIVGINGSGKTTILDAIAISLSWLVARIRRQTGSGQTIDDKDIHYDALFSSIKITCEENKNIFSWKITKNTKGSINNSKSELIELSSLALLFQEILEKDESLPVVIFYPVGRVVDKINPSIKGSESLSIWDVYDNALGAKQNFYSFFEWFRIQDDLKNEKLSSRNQWLQQNRDWIKKRIKSIISMISDSSINNLSEGDFQHQSQKILDTELFYQEPRLLFHEIAKLYETANISSGKDKRIFYDLTYSLNSMETYAKEFKDDFINDTIGYYKENIYRIFSLFETEKLSVNTLNILFETFMISNSLCLWWVSDKSKKIIDKRLKEYFNNIFSSKKQKAGELITQLGGVLWDESFQSQSSYRSEGRVLEIVRKAIEEFIPEYSQLTVKRYPRPHMLVNKGDEQFNLDQLSDGEKNLITLVGDIARRLAIGNSHSEDPLKERGIILIDEIDLHLHPSWQRLMIPQLRKIFPNCQFIVSTHSPQVLSHTQPESLFLLKNDKGKLTFNKAMESFGMNTDRILEDLLGVDARPSKQKKAIKNLYTLIDANKLEEAGKEIEELTKTIGDDPELVKARVLIKRKEIIGK